MRLRLGNRKGNAVLEFALVAPLLIPMLLAVLDFGMYTYAFISVQNASRVAAMRNSSGPDSAADQASACAMAIEEMRGLPNIGASFQSGCTASPLIVTSVLCNGATACTGTTMSADGQSASSVTVKYTMPAVFVIPVVGPTAISRTSEMRIRNMQ